MKTLVTLWKREVGAAFVSPVAYITIAMFLVVMGLGFWSILAYGLSQGASGHDVLRTLYGGMSWYANLMVVPLLTMRALAEEKRQGTLETLLTAPVSNLQVVIAKFLGLCTVYLAMWLPTLAYLFVLERTVGATQFVDVGAVASSYLGISLIGLFMLSLGLFCSSLTRNLIAAAISTYALLAVFLIFGFFHASIPWPELRAVTEPLSPIEHMLDFSRGMVDLRPVVLYLSGTFLMLGATAHVLESRRWRS